MKEQTNQDAEVEVKKTEVEVVKQEVEKKEVVVPQKFSKIIDAVNGLTVIELNELVKVFEEEYGVSASAMMATAPVVGGGADDLEVAVVAVELTSAGEQKIQVIKAVKEIFELGLKEAKDLVDDAPTTLKEDVAKEEAETIKKKIEEVGGTISFK